MIHFLMDLGTRSFMVETIAGSVPLKMLNLGAATRNHWFRMVFKHFFRAGYVCAKKEAREV